MRSACCGDNCRNESLQTGGALLLFWRGWSQEEGVGVTVWHLPREFPPIRCLLLVCEVRIGAGTAGGGGDDQRCAVYVVCQPRVYRKVTAGKGVHRSNLKRNK